MDSDRDFSWPNQGAPTRSDWELWRKYLKLAIFSRGRRLKSPLGPWMNDTDSGTWFIEPRSEHLHRKLGSVWYFHPRIPRRSGRPTYSTTGSVCEPPALYIVLRYFIVVTT